MGPPSFIKKLVRKVGLLNAFPFVSPKSTMKKYLNTDKPIRKVLAGGSVIYRLNHLLHRYDGPAVRYHDIEYWFFHGRLHRDDGPAVTCLSDITIRVVLASKFVILGYGDMKWFVQNKRFTGPKTLQAV